MERNSMIGVSGAFSRVLSEFRGGVCGEFMALLARRVPWRYWGRYWRFGAVVNAGLLFLALASPAPAAELPRLVLLGDSLVAGYGLPEAEAFPAVLERALAEAGRLATVINAGVSGDTTAGGKARLAWMLADRPDAAVVELGANDGLRGIDPAETRANLDTILTQLSVAGVPALLAGMYAPPNLGREYGAEFDAIYPDLARVHGAALYPFFLEGVAMEAGLNQADGIHPNAQGVERIVAAILPYVLALLDEADSAGADSAGADSAGAD